MSWQCERASVQHRSKSCRVDTPRWFPKSSRVMISSSSGPRRWTLDDWTCCDDVMALSANNNYLTVHADDWKCQVNKPGTVEPDFKFDGIDTVLPRSDIGHAEECPANEALNQADKTSGDHRWKHRDFKLHRKTRLHNVFCFRVRTSCSKGWYVLHGKRELSPDS